MGPTPGPWVVREAEDGELLEVYREEGGSLIAFAADAADQQANACLIAAAPDLLDALWMCAWRWDEYDEDDAPELGQAIRAAIAKAEGRTE